jgi:hypothetical protein
LSKTGFGLVALSLVLGLLLVAALPHWEAAPAFSAPGDQEEPGASSSGPPGGLGMVPSSADKQSLVGLPEGLGAAEELPEAVDLTEPSSLLQGQPSGDGIAPIGDQGNTATCTGWAAGYYYKTYQEWLEHGWDLENGGPDYEHIFSPSFVYNQITDKTDWNCDDGAQIGDAIALIVDQGDLPWSEFQWNPYNCGIQPSTAQKDAAVEYDGISYGAFFIDVGPPYGPQLNHDLTPLKQWIANDDPFVLGFPIYSEFDYYDCNQVVTPPANPGSYRGLHAVAVVGYDNNWAGVGGFKIVNSYGEDWGCYGYAWLSYSFVRKYAWEAWWMTSNRPPWIDPHVPDRYSPNIGDTILVDLTPYENDREDSGTKLKWYVEGADHCSVGGEGSSNDVLSFQPDTGYSGLDEITLVLRDSDDAEDRQQLTLGWFDLNIEYYLPLGLRH